MTSTYFTVPSPVVAVNENLVRLLGRYSEGFRLTAEHGARSVAVCEYAYRNLPQGSSAIGRLIDRQFLQMSAWDAMRQRWQSTREIVLGLISQRRGRGLPTMLLDIASGTAPYLREIVRQHGGEDLAVACHDRDPRQVMHGRDLLVSEGLHGISFSVGDATDHSSYLTNRDPDIILAIDLFPWLAGDDEVRKTMQLSFDHLSKGGAFVCTTITKVMAGPVQWEGVGARFNPALRSPDKIYDCLRHAGFIRIDQRFSQPFGFALVGWKPTK